MRLQARTIRSSPGLRQASVAGFVPDDGVGTDSGDEGRTSYLFPHTVPISGMNHTLHNLMQDVDTHLTGWDECWRQLKNVAALLANDQRRRRVWAVCVQGTSYDHMRGDFEKGVPSLYEKRWGLVLEFIIRVRPLLLVLRATWSAVKYEQGHAHAGAAEDDQRQSEFSVGDFTQMLRSSFFFAYLDMLTALHKTTKNLTGWCEGCRCHEHILRGKTRHQREQALRADYSGHPGVESCVMAGCRADECAAGDLARALDEIGALRLADLLSKTQIWLTPDELKKITDDFQSGKDFFALGLSVKTLYWQKLPWKLAALSHPSESIARLNAAACVDLWEQTPADARDLHHPLATLCLSSDGPVRGDLNRFIAGAARADLAAATQRTIACFKFWPIVERVVEATHKEMTKRTASNRSGVVTLSLAVRGTPVLERACGSRAGLEALLGCLAQTRKIRCVPDLLGCSGHPKVVSLRESGGAVQTSKWHAELTQIIYRAGSESMFRDVRALGKEHGREQGHLKRQAEKFCDKAPLSQDALLAAALVTHLREVVPDGAVCSVPRTRSGLQLLPEALHRNRAAAAKVPQWETDDGKELEEVVPAIATAGAAAALPCDSDHQVFLRLLHKKPAAWKTIPMSAIAGGRLSSRALAYSALKCSGDSEYGQMVSPSSALVIADLTRGTDLQALRARAKVWAEAPEPCYSVEGLLPALRPSQHRVVTRVVKALFQQQATPAHSGALTLPAQHEHSELLHSMARLDLVQAENLGSHCRWRFTQHGVRSVQACSALATSTPMCDLRPDLTLLQRTSYELQLLLQDQGWEWRLLPGPRSRARRNIRPYVVGAERVWYASGVQAETAYLVALLDAQRLLDEHGIQEIPHAAHREVYMGLLEGKPAAQRQLALGSAAGAALPKMMDDMGDGSENAADEGAGGDGDAGDNPDGGDAEPRLARPEPSEDADSDFEMLSHGGAEVPFDIEAELDDMFDGHMAAQPVPLAPVPAPQAAATAAEAARPALDLKAPGRWGCFSISVKRRTRFGGYQGSCPWHAKSSKTGCKKEHIIRGPTEADRKDALLRCMHWCSQARSVKWQYEHVFLVEGEPHPPEEVVLASVIHEFPDRVNPDTEGPDAPRAPPASDSAPGAPPSLPPAPGPPRRRRRVGKLRTGAADPPAASPAPSGEQATSAGARASGTNGPRVSYGGSSGSVAAAAPAAEAQLEQTAPWRLPGDEESLLSLVSGGPGSGQATARGRGGHGSCGHGGQVQGHSSAGADRAGRRQPGAAGAAALALATKGLPFAFHFERRPLELEFIASAVHLQRQAPHHVS